MDNCLAEKSFHSNWSLIHSPRSARRDDMHVRRSTVEHPFGTIKPGLVPRTFVPHTAENGVRDGALRARLQHETRYKDSRRHRIDGRDGAARAEVRKYHAKACDCVVLAASGRF